MTIFSRTELVSAGKMHLNCEAKSDEAKELVVGLVEKVVLPFLALKKPPRPTSMTKYQLAVGALLADLLRLNQDGKCGAHGMSPKDFSEIYGFGQLIFARVKDALVGDGFLQYQIGKQQIHNISNYNTGELVTVSGGGWISRFKLTQKALEDIEVSLGSLTDWYGHWLRRPVEQNAKLSRAPLVSLRAMGSGPIWRKKQGRPMKVDYTHPAVINMVDDLKEHNSFLITMGVEGFDFQGLRRQFSYGDQPGFNWQWHGRFYSQKDGERYEGLNGPERRDQITLAGKAVGEVDMAASQLTLLCALTASDISSQPDLYDINDLDRELVKRWITRALGRGNVTAAKWSKDSVGYYRKISPDGNLSVDHPMKKYRDAILVCYPILSELGSDNVPTVLDLQFQESEVLRRAMKSLMKLRIPSLPVHDSLVVPRDRMKEAEYALVAAFSEQVKQVTGSISKIIPVIKHKAK